MKNIDRIIKSTLTSILALTVTGTAINAPTALAEEKMDKCYGIVKAGMNDCQTLDQSCAGSSVKDNQADAFIFLPKGICEKIVGGVVKK